MNIALLLLFLVFCNSSHSSGLITNVTTRPDVLNIGSIFTFDSVIGKIAKLAISTAVEDVNSNPNILNGTKLSLKLHNTKSSDFLGIVEGMKNLQSAFNFSCIGMNCIFNFSCFVCSFAVYGE